MTWHAAGMPPKAKKTGSYDEAAGRGPWVQALCIGVDDYEHLPKLQNAVKDAAAIAQKVNGENLLLKRAHERSCVSDLCFPVFGQISPIIRQLDLTIFKSAGARILHPRLHCRPCSRAF